MNTYRILIVEDEVIIADSIKRHLEKDGHQIAGTAISYEEAQRLYMQEQPDLILLDIRLNGPKTGIDLAHFINNQSGSTPFIYLTSQMDKRNFNKAKETLPAGYLSKPVRKEQLFASIELAMHRHIVQTTQAEFLQTITLREGKNTEVVAVRDILYIQTQHVYAKIHMRDRFLLQRGSLAEVLQKIPGQCIVQVHRSFAVNLQHVNRWDQHNLYIGEEPIPISRSRRKAVLKVLAQN